MQNLNTNGNNQELLSKLMQLSMRKTIQEILEQDVSEHIGKGYYEQGQNRNGHRNGYKSAHIRTAEDKLLVERPLGRWPKRTVPLKRLEAHQG